LKEAQDYRPGDNRDVAASRLTAHTGLVSDRSADGRPLLVHPIGAGPKLRMSCSPSHSWWCRGCFLDVEGAKRTSDRKWSCQSPFSTTTRLARCPCQYPRL